MPATSLHVSSRDVAVAVVSGLLGMIAVAIAVGWFLIRAGTEPVEVAETPTPILEPVVMSSNDADLKFRELKAELLSAKSDLKLLQEQRIHEWEQTALLLDTLLEAGDSTELDSTASMSYTLEKLHRRYDAESDEFFGQLDDLIFYAILAGLKGPNAVQELANTINDPSADLKLRQVASSLLYMIPSGTSLQLILNPPEDLRELGEDIDPELGSIAMIVDTLPHTQVTPYLSDLYNLAVGELERSPQDDQGWSLLGVLALNHRYPPALDVLNRPRNFELFGDKLLEMAWWIGTDESRAIIERLSREHPQPDIREKANEILAGW